MAVTSVRIERDRLAAFQEIAAANRRSASQELRWLIDRHIERHTPILVVERHDDQDPVAA